MAVAAHALKIVNEYDQEIPQSQTADNPLALYTCFVQDFLGKQLPRLS